MMDDSKKAIVKGALDKIKLVDAGVKDKYGYGPVKMSKPVSEKDRVYYPSLHLDTKEAPMLSGADVGEHVCLLVKAKDTSHSMDESPDRKNERFSLEIRKIGVVYIGSEKEA